MVRGDGVPTNLVPPRALRVELPQEDVRQIFRQEAVQVVVRVLGTRVRLGRVVGREQLVDLGVGVVEDCLLYTSDAADE